MPEFGSPQDDTPGPLTVTTLPEILTLIPYLLGFTPVNSLVALGFADSAGPAIRVDLAPADQPVETQDALAATVGDRIAAVMTRNEATAVILAGYGESEPVTAFGTIVESRLREAKLQVLEFVRVQDDRYWSYTCTDSVSCPLDGTPLNSHTSTVAAEAVLRGYTVADNRAAIVASLAPVSGPDGDRMRSLIDEVSTQLTARTQGLNPAARRLYLIEQGQTLVDSIYERVRLGVAFELFDDVEIARLLVLLQETFTRDLAMIGIGGPHDPELLEFWRQTLRRAIPGMALAPACLTAHAAIRRGEGAVAQVALDRGAEDDPHSPMLTILRMVAQEGANPNDLPITSREEFTEICRQEIEQLGRDAERDDESGEPG